MRKSKNRGFTLIEVIVALFVFAVLSMIGYKGISSLIQIKDRVEIEDRKWQQLVLFCDRFELDVKQSVNRSIIKQDGGKEPAWLGRPSFIDEYGAQLSFSRFGDPEQSGFLMDTRRIGYRLDGGAIKLLIWPSLDLSSTAKPEIFEVLSHVDQLTISYLSADGRWVYAWPEDSVAIQQKTIAPVAVKLIITLETGETVVRVFAL